jgi:hypothetical protein
LATEALADLLRALEPRSDERAPNLGIAYRGLSTLNPWAGQPRHSTTVPMFTSTAMPGLEEL